MYWWWCKLLFSAVSIFSAAVSRANADTVVTGAVFCDQCKDGQISLYDYPIYGVQVGMACVDNKGQITTSREETTGWFGKYAIRFDGTPDLSNCYVQVSSKNVQDSNGCTASAGPAQKLRLMYNMFDMQFYAADSLLSQPAQPMPYCPRSTTPVPAPVTPVRPPGPIAPVTPSPPLGLPPLPPMPFLQASACTYQKWMAPEYKCYWRALNPDMKVALVFGDLAARRYGTDMTLWQALQGRGDPYRTLLREGTTALLNSYNSIQFSYNSLSVVTHMNQALMGSTRSVLLTALRFLRANSGSPNVTCMFRACK